MSTVYYQEPHYDEWDADPAEFEPAGEYVSEEELETLTREQLLQAIENSSSFLVRCPDGELQVVSSGQGFVNEDVLSFVLGVDDAAAAVLEAKEATAA